MDRPRRSDCTAGQMDGEAGWWTTSGNIGLPPLARAMGVGRQQQLEEKAYAGLVNLYEDLATWHDSPWLNWRCLNRLRTGYTCSKEQRKKWGYFNGDTTCECGLAAESTAHMLQCSLLAHPCTLDDFLELNDTAQACTERWKKIV